MSASPYSQTWFRVAALVPRLRANTRIERHLYRGQAWYVVQNGLGLRHHRLSPSAYRFVAMLDGKATVQQAYERLENTDSAGTPSQDEIIDLLARLHEADVLDCAVTADARELLNRNRQRDRRRLWQRIGNPLAMRVPLFDVNAWLLRCAPLAEALFAPPAALLWVTVVATGMILTGVHWTDLSEGSVDRLFTAQNLIILSVVYPVLKFFHELGHALAARAFGVNVRETGISILFLMPVPYVDVSGIAVLPDKRQRMIVSAAGIAVELFAAALALFLWLNVEPGLIRAAAFNVMLIGGISTLFINGNPLLRFDGYYLLADALEIPNLASRSNQYAAYLAQRYLLGLWETRSPATAAGEAPWLLGYGLASFAYRTVLLFSLALYLTDSLPLVGTALAGYAVIGQLLLPAIKPLRFLLSSPALAGQRSRGLALAASAGLLAGLFLFIIPLPTFTQAQGIIQPPEDAQVRSGIDGFVVRVRVARGAEVHRDDPLIETTDPVLQARERVLTARLNEVVARYQASRVSDLVKAGVIEEERRAVEEELQQVQSKVAALLVRSPADGVFLPAQPDDLVGRFVHQGEVLGFIVGDAPARVRVVVQQTDIAQVNGPLTGVDVRLAAAAERILPAQIDARVPQATDRLPGAALGTRGGGEIAVNPEKTDGTEALDKHFQLDLALPLASRDLPIGARAYVRFAHPDETLAARGWRLWRQVFLEHLNG